MTMDITEAQATIATDRAQRAEHAARAIADVLTTYACEIAVHLQITADGRITGTPQVIAR